MNWIKEHFIASSMALVVIVIATWATPFLVLMALTTTLIVPTRLALGARPWPVNGLDSIIEHLAAIFIFFLGTMLLIGVVFVAALELVGGSDGLILWFTAATVFDCAACTVWVAKWTVDAERAKAALVGSRNANTAPAGAAKRVQA